MRIQLLLPLLFWFAAAPEAAVASSVRWRVVPANSGGESLHAVALDSASGRVAIGHDRGGFTGGPAGVFEIAVVGSAVRDLAYVDTGGARAALIAATTRGLVAVTREGRRSPVAPGPGEASRDTLRLSAAGGVVAVATADGAFASTDLRVWKRLSSVLPSGPVTAIALRSSAQPVGASGLECWLVIESQLWRLHTPLPPAGAGTPRVERISLPSAPSDGGPVDIRLDLPGADVVLVYPSVLAISAAAGAGSLAGADDNPSGRRRFSLVRPVLPPQAEATRVAFALGRYWLATSRGLLEAEELAGPWRRTTSPAGSSPVHALAGDARQLYAASEGRLLFAEAGDAPLRASGDAESRGSSLERPMRNEPTVDVVHRAAIRHLRLSRQRLVSRERRVRRRGWLPIVSLRGGYDQDRLDETKYDQAYISGGMRSLVDRDHDRASAYDVSVTAAWDLGDVVFEPEEIDVSREERAVLALRDDVLDEISQLFFERRRVLLEIAELEPSASLAAERLRLRADELASGIDAWTGGWWSRQAPPLALRGSFTGPDPRIEKENGT